VYPAQPLSKTDQKPEAPPTNYEPAGKTATNGAAASEKIVTDPLEESHEELVARCNEIMKQVSA
jgi:hypothetical protein